MLDQININGMTKVEQAIERIKMFDVGEEGWYVAFSGGKDSVVLKALCDMAGVKYEAVYRVTSVDPPELIQFIKQYHPDVKFDKPRDKDGNHVTMWNLIPQKSMPPTRVVRYCCKYLKEEGGKGRYRMTGVRWDESGRRARQRTGIELDTGKRQRETLDPDNMDDDMTKYCMQKGAFILNPIIDWTDDEIWEFIRIYNVPYCKLYDEGFKRLGCIGCPMSSRAKSELERFPTYKRNYIKAFNRMLEVRKEKGLETQWNTGQEVYDWWVGDKK